MSNHVRPVSCVVAAVFSYWHMDAAIRHPQQSSGTAAARVGIEPDSQHTPLPAHQTASCQFAPQLREPSSRNSGGQSDTASDAATSLLSFANPDVCIKKRKRDSDSFHQQKKLHGTYREADGEAGTWHWRAFLPLAAGRWCPPGPAAGTLVFDC